VDSLELRIFQREAWFQCEYIGIAAEALRRVEADYDSPVGDVTLQVWFYVTAILGSAANLSKLFWGSQGKKAHERGRLRQTLGVSDPSCLEPTSLRNAFEHLDEKLKLWLYQQGASATIEDYGREFGEYVPQTGTVEFRDRSVSLRAIVEEANRIRPIAEGAAGGSL
jgi:hypothetical protein